MIHSHPYIRYAQSLLLVENQLDNIDSISIALIKAEIKKGLDTFCVKPKESFKNKKNVKYCFVNEKNSASAFIYLSSSVISSEKTASSIYDAAVKYIRDIDNLCIQNEVRMSTMPLSGEYGRFTENNVSRGKAKCSMYEQGLALITSLTPNKPCLRYQIGKNGFNVCIIPDIPLEEMMDFIKLFKRMRIQQLESDLMFGQVKEEKGKFEPKRPKIFQGNFPNPPRSNSMGSIALLGAIGEMAKESEVSALAHRVLDSLKDTTLYMVQYGNASTYTYNHYVVELAKKSKLKSIVDSIYYTELYSERRIAKSTEYQKFDLFTSRFLLLFNPSSFSNFLSFT